MKTIAVAVVCAFAAVAAAGFGWMKYQELAAAKAQLTTTNTELQKTRADLRATQTELAALRKEAADAKLAMEQMQADLTTARSFLEAEKGVSARLRDELNQAKQQLAAAGRRPAAQAGPASAPPSVYNPKPMGVRLAPGGPTAAGAGAPAR
jgi:septal ring factor EnvC (AmiA/AmiB activator)